MKVSNSVKSFNKSHTKQHTKKEPLFHDASAVQLEFSMLNKGLKFIATFHFLTPNLTIILDTE